MRRIGYLGLGLVFVATTALAAEKRRDAGTLARAATSARAARSAEIAKDATPPKVGSSKRRTNNATVSAETVRIPIAP